MDLIYLGNLYYHRIFFIFIILKLVYFFLKVVQHLSHQDSKFLPKDYSITIHQWYTALLKYNAINKYKYTKDNVLISMVFATFLQKIIFNIIIGKIINILILKLYVNDFFYGTDFYRSNRTENATIFPLTSIPSYYIFCEISSINVNFLDLSINFISVHLAYLSMEFIKKL